MRTYGRTEKWVIAEETSLFKIVVKTSNKPTDFLRRPVPLRKGMGNNWTCRVLSLYAWSTCPLLLDYLDVECVLPAHGVHHQARQEEAYYGSGLGKGEYFDRKQPLRQSVRTPYFHCISCVSERSLLHKALVSIFLALLLDTWFDFEVIMNNIHNSLYCFISYFYFFI